MRRSLTAAVALAMSTMMAMAAEPVADATTEDTLKASLMAMIDALPQEQRPALGKALMTLGMADVIMSARPGGAGLPNAPEGNAIDNIRALVGGKTAAEIIAMADEKVPSLR